MFFLSARAARRWIARILLTWGIISGLTALTVGPYSFFTIRFALGLVGASFAVGTPYVARFFPKERRGFAMGVFGAGTISSATINLTTKNPAINAHL